MEEQLNRIVRAVFEESYVILGSTLRRMFARFLTDAASLGTVMLWRAEYGRLAGMSLHMP